MSRTFVKLTGWVVLTGALMVYLAFTIGNIKLFNDTYRMTATFNDATGMLPADNVKIAGVIVGKVKAVTVEKGKAKVSFEVQKSTKLPADTEAAVRWRNLLGQRYLYLYPGSAPTVLKSGDHISNTRSVVDIGELFNRLGPIIKAIKPEQVNIFLDGITTALDGNQEGLRQTIDDLAVLVQSLAKRDEAIGRVIENLNTVAGAVTSRDQQVRTVLDNLLTLAQTFSSNTDVLNQSITDLTEFSDNFNYLLANNRGQLEGIISNLRTLTDLIDTRLPTLDNVVEGLDDAARVFFNTSRFGEWQNQAVPCGTITPAPGVFLNTYATGCTDDLSAVQGGQVGVGAGTPVQQALGAPPAPVSGTAAVGSLLGGLPS